MKYANCSVCEKLGRPSGFHTIGVEGSKLEIRCSTCGSLVAALTLAKPIEEEIR